MFQGVHPEGNFRPLHGFPQSGRAIILHCQNSALHEPTNRSNFPHVRHYRNYVIEKALLNKHIKNETIISFVKI
jgi:hypothetical protein